MSNKREGKRGVSPSPPSVLISPKRIYYNTLVVASKGKGTESMIERVKGFLKECEDISEGQGRIGVSFVRDVGDFKGYSVVVMQSTDLEGMESVCSLLASDDLVGDYDKGSLTKTEFDDLYLKELEGLDEEISYLVKRVRRGENVVIVHFRKDNLFRDSLEWILFDKYNLFIKRGRV